MTIRLDGFGREGLNLVDLHASEMPPDQIIIAMTSSLSDLTHSSAPNLNLCALANPVAACQAGLRAPAVWCLTSQRLTSALCNH